MKIILIFLAGVVVGFLLERSRGGVLAHTEEQRKAKEEGKRKILEMLGGRETVSNNDVEKMLGVSDRSATRYLDELEREGKVEQVGKTGRAVSYRLK